MEMAEGLSDLDGALDGAFRLGCFAGSGQQHRFDAGRRPALVRRVAAQVFVDQPGGLLDSSELEQCGRLLKGQQRRIALHRRAVEDSQGGVVSSAVEVDHAKSKPGQGVRGVDRERLLDLGPGFVEQSDVEIHHRQLVMRLVELGIERDGLLVRLGRLFVRKTVGVRPQQQAA